MIKFFIWAVLLTQSVYANNFETMGHYEGFRAGVEKTKALDEDGNETDEYEFTTFLKTQKLDLTPIGLINLHIYFLPKDKKESDNKKHPDQFMFSIKLSPDDYLKIFESEEKLTEYTLPHAPNSMGFDDNLLKVSANGKRSNRNVTMKYTSDDDYRSYEAKYVLKDGKFVSYSMEQRSRKGLFTIGLKVFMDAKSSELKKVYNGLELRQGYQTAVTKEEDIRSAANDSSVKNFNRLAKKYDYNLSESDDE